MPTLVLSVVEPPSLELKPLPNNLKYAFLSSDDTLPMIISSDLLVSEEIQLLNVLKKYKKAIGWTLADIPGINPTMCTNRILLQDDARPLRKP